MNVKQRIAALAAAGLLTLGAATASAAVIRFGADLDPEAAGATGDGTVLVEYDDVGRTLRITSSWTGLSGTTTIAHIHCCVAPPGTVFVAVTPGTLPDFPVGLMAGSYVSPLIDLTQSSSFNGAFLTQSGGTPLSATSALLAGMTNGTAYFNIHTSRFPGGEIRGFLQQQKVPEPSLLSLLLLGFLPLAGLRLRKD